MDYLNQLLIWQLELLEVLFKPGGGLFSKANIGNTMSKAGGYADMIGSLFRRRSNQHLLLA